MAEVGVVRSGAGGAADGGESDSGSESDSGGEGDSAGEPGRLIGLRDGANDEIVQLEAEIALRRERVAASLGELRRRVQGATSWRHWARSHPIAWIGAGLFFGFVLGYGGRGRRRGE